MLRSSSGKFPLRVQPLHRVGLRWLAFALLFVFVFVLLFVFAGSRTSAADWSDDWQATNNAAADDTSRPILVKYEASWCGPCRMLTEALKEPGVSSLLEGMHLVRIDVDAPPEGAPVEGVEALPTMRVMTVTGEVLSEQVGLLQDDALLRWLRDGQENYKAKQAAMQLVKRLGSGSLDDEQTQVLMEMLTDRSPRQRAAAAGLLIAHPKEVASSVIELFARPKLRPRLAALDVLRRWTAPVAGLDPWQPETISDQRLADLRTWAESLEQQESLLAKLADDAEHEAELELDRLVRRGDVREGVVDSLGLMGPDLLPSVDKRLSLESADTARRRLSSVLYRLVAAPTLAIRLPNVTDQLASLDADPRRRAAKTLADQAKQEDLRLLETLFGHSDPLVRELALRGLQNAGGGDTTRLTELLEDPDKNVRAAVLKLWLDDPKPSLLEPVSALALRETDSGLLVYYVRLLKELKGESKESLETLHKLASHDDWQVRAEVAEAISHRVTDSSENSFSFGVATQPTKLPEELLTAARELLGDSDSFVLSKIVPAILDSDQEASFDQLLEVAWHHEAIRDQILPSLKKESVTPKATDFLAARFESEKAADRVFALDVMSQLKLGDQKEYFQRGIEDADHSVQAAAARSLVNWLDAYPARLEQMPPSGQGNDLYERSLTYMDNDSVGGVVVEMGGGITVETPSLIGGLLDGLGSLFGSGGEEASPEEVSPEEASPEGDLEPGSTEPRIAEPDPEELNADYEREMERAMAQEIGSEDDVDDLFDVVEEPDFGEIGSEDDVDDLFDVVEESDFGMMDNPFGDTDSEEVDVSAAAAKYQQWLEAWRRSPESELPWLAGLRPKLEELARQGGESEVDATMALLRIGGDADAAHILKLVSHREDKHRKIETLYPWLSPETRLELFELIGGLEEAADLLPAVLTQVRRFDPDESEDSFWNALKNVDLGSMESSWNLRRSLMLVTTGREYFYSIDPEQTALVAEKLANRLTSVDELAAKLLGLSVLSELDAEKVAEIVGDDYADTSTDDVLRRDWARMAIASRKEHDATALSIEMMDDDALLPVALAFITESYEGVAATETGEVAITGVGADSVASGKLTLATIASGVDREILLPLLEHEDAAVVAAATYGLAILDDDVDMEPLILAARSETPISSLHGMTNLLVLAIAHRNRDDEVEYLTEIYDDLYRNESPSYYVADFYWKIRIMDGPRALALRKRIRDDVGMSELL